MDNVLRIFEEAYREGRKYLLEPEAKKVLLEYGFPIGEFRVARNEEEAVKFADKMGYPIVLKIVSPDVLHKSDVGGVIVKIKDAKAVLTAYKTIMENVKKHNAQAKIVGLLVEKMAPPTTEVIVGAVKDPQFGPTLMFGLGGIFVELLEDVTFRVAPIQEDEAIEMITEVKAYPLLMGYRNLPSVDIEAIKTILLSTSRLVMEHQEIKELDLNPILVYEKGAKIVDARIILE